MRYICEPLALFLALAAPLAQAQVFKCAAPGGRTVYSDSPCSGGSTGGMVERERTYQEKLQERQMAYEAEMLKQERRMAQQQREWAEQDRAMQYQPAPVARPGNDWQSRKDRENARTAASSITRNGGRWDEAAESQRREDARARARANPPRPTDITNCHGSLYGGFCTDNQGGTYQRSGRDFMTGPNGQACHRAGNIWNCN